MSKCIAAPGRLGDLNAAIAQCDAAIANRPAHGDSAWASLATTRILLAGRRARLRAPKKRITKDGEIDDREAASPWGERPPNGAAPVRGELGLHTGCTLDHSEAIAISPNQDEADPLIEVMRWVLSIDR